MLILYENVNWTSYIADSHVIEIDEDNDQAAVSKDIDSAAKFTGADSASKAKDKPGPAATLAKVAEDAGK